MAVAALTAYTNEMYRTFWRRTGAALVDGLILLPFDFCLLWTGQRATVKGLAILIYWVHATFTIAYSILLHGKYGQTLGKMMTRVKVLDLVGNPIGLRRAVIRDGPWLALALADIATATVAILSGKNAWDLGAATPWVLGLAGFIWMIAELITMLTNPRRRAIHDWLAGTVVVRIPRKTDV
jgi:uncharacterized RDD family membrane protein YckC